jgi:hypothetical protein
VLPLSSLLAIPHLFSHVPPAFLSALLLQLCTGIPVAVGASGGGSGHPRDPRTCFNIGLRLGQLLTDASNLLTPAMVLWSWAHGFRKARVLGRRQGTHF